MNKRPFIPFLAAAVFASGAALADDKHQKPAMSHGAAQSGAMADGEIRKVDADAGKLTIRHGEIKSLDMPPMTMVFRVKDPSTLKAVKPGDKVRFNVENVGGALTVTMIEAVK